MYIYSTVFILLLVNYGQNAMGTDAADGKGTESAESCYARVSTCEANSGGGRRPVCGTNGRTYPTKCRMLRAQCAGEPVALAHRGPCTEGQSCLIALRYAKKAEEGRRAAFVPRCRADGAYAAVQCAAGSAAGCWCVTPDGHPLPDTAVRNGRPDCTRTGKAHTKRRSSARGQRNKRSCTRADRAVFNGNLMKIFSGEQEREGSGPPLEARAVADWKFRELDRDRNGVLQKAEYRGLRRLIKKVVKPKRCARAWARGCDADGDGSLARAEWAACLLAAPDPPAPDYDENAPQPAPEGDYTEEDAPPLEHSAVLPGTLMRQAASAVAAEGGAGSGAGGGGAGAGDSRRDDDVNDCITDRQAVLDEQKAGGAALYVPECTGDGRYARAQCYRSTPYCWCVHQDTGKPIPGSSVKDRRPDCDAAPKHSSPMRGCPEPMKTNFLRDLMKFFLTKMTTTVNGTVPGEMVKWGASREEQAAKWTFVMLDKDKNKMLERREWRSFHQLIAGAEGLKRCGKKLPRYCDVNHDGKISITEWLTCLDVTQATRVHAAEPTKTPSSSRRRGPNPLESFLKADD